MEEVDEREWAVGCLEGAQMELVREQTKSLGGKIIMHGGESGTKENGKCYLPVILTDQSQSITGLHFSVTDCDQLVKITSKQIFLIDFRSKKSRYLQQKKCGQNFKNSATNL